MSARTMSPPVPGSNADIGSRVGRLAYELFPGGVEVTEAAYEHMLALTRTRALMGDPEVSAIFEAALEFENIRVRVDVLERLEDGTWGIREVKSAASIRQGANLKVKYARDIAVQTHVARGAGLEISSVQFIYVNGDYELPGEGAMPDPQKFFRQAEVLEELNKHLEAVPDQAAAFLEVLDQAEPPTTEPAKAMCKNLGDAMCPFWDQCTADKPDDWIDGLYFPRGKQLKDLKEQGLAQLSSLEAGQVIENRHKPHQIRMAKVAKSAEPCAEASLGAALKDIPLPAIHLDFEYVAGCAWPLHGGNRPHQKIPFQFSAHRLNTDLSYDHIDEYLAEGSTDPSREFAQRLIALLGDSEEPIIAYSAPNAETPVMKGLEERFEDLAPALEAIRERIIDLADTVRENVMHPAMITKAVRTGGSLYTLKSVAPALAPGFTYADLGVVAQGGAAVEAYYQMVTGQLPEGVSRKDLRGSMLAYCKKDTEATTLVHKALIEMNEGGE